MALGKDRLFSNRLPEGAMSRIHTMDTKQG